MRIHHYRRLPCHLDHGPAGENPQNIAVQTGVGWGELLVASARRHER